MPKSNEQLLAYVATLLTLILIFLGSLIAGAFNPGIIGKIGEFGLGTITGGLIGVLRMPQQRSIAVDAPVSDTPTPAEAGNGQ